MATNSLNSAVAITRIVDSLKLDGLLVEASHDFEDLETQVSSLDNKELTAQFSLANFELYEANAFWVGIRNKKGKLVSIHCSRTYELGKRSLAKHWQLEQKRLYNGPARLGKTHSPLANQITGKVAYHGDFWISDKLRGKCDVGPMVFLAFLLCYNYQNPDWIYGRMADKLANEKGFVQRCGFSHADPYGTDWEVEPVDKGVHKSNWLCAVDREGIEFRAGVIVRNGLGFLQRK